GEKNAGGGTRITPPVKVQVGSGNLSKPLPVSVCALTTWLRLVLTPAPPGIPRREVDRGRSWPGHARGVERHGAALSRRHGGRLRGTGDRGSPPIWSVPPGGAWLAEPL